MQDRFRSLDGWRAVSILFVLAGHLLPLGPKSWSLNGAFAGSGMALFFILSGFLITTLLLQDSNVKHFLIRRFMRIVPLAWLVLIVTLVLTSAPLSLYPSHLLFYGNLWDVSLVKPASHFWSLCVEMQFYVGIALLVALFGTRALWALPVICLTVTGYRILNSVEMAVATQFRIDEILAGCILALAYHRLRTKAQLVFLNINSIYLLPVLLLSAHDGGGALNYLRPYIAMLVIGATLFKTDNAWWNRWLDHAVLKYIATISYALYVIHGGLRETWLASGDVVTRYVKRPLFFTVTFALAHMSTFYFEKYWIALGKRLTKGRSTSLG